MWLKRLGSYLLAVFIAYVLATVAATQHVAGRLEGMGAEVSFGTRMEMIGHDLAGMVGSFLPLIAVGLLIAFLVTALVLRLAPAWRLLLYPLAGAAGVVCVHVGLNMAFDLTPVAAARTVSGLLVQGLAGAVGGYAFARISPGPSPGIA